MVHGFRVFPTADDDLNVVREGPGEPIGWLFLSCVLVEKVVDSVQNNYDFAVFF
jgi:hypothetical protein